MVSAVPQPPDAPPAPDAAAPTAPDALPPQASSPESHASPAPSESGPLAIWPSGALPPLPPSSRSLLSRYFALDENLAALSAESGKDFIDLYEFLHSALIAPWVAIHRAHTNHRRANLALDTLESLIKTTSDDVERRRAATSLLRNLAHLHPTDRRATGFQPVNLGGDGGPNGTDVPSVSGYSVNRRAWRYHGTANRLYSSLPNVDPANDHLPLSPNAHWRRRTIPIPEPTHLPNPTHNAKEAVTALAQAFALHTVDDSLSTIHAFAAPGASINLRPVPEDPADFFETINVDLRRLLLGRPTLQSVVELKDGGTRSEWRAIINSDFGPLRINLARASPTAPWLFTRIKFPDTADY